MPVAIRVPGVLRAYTERPLKKEVSGVTVHEDFLISWAHFIKLSSSTSHYLKSSTPDEILDSISPITALRQEPMLKVVDVCYSEVTQDSFLEGRYYALECSVGFLLV